ncbi:hypothetical protein OROHE_004948 [Orobanche hederae]
MGRRLHRRVVREAEEEVVDWIKLPDDTIITIFFYLNHRDRASLSSTCRAWRALGKSLCLWRELDLGHHKFNASVASSLASRCQNLLKLRLRLSDSDAIIILQAKNLCELNFGCYRNMTDMELGQLAARHKALECLQIGGYSASITGVGIKAAAICCPRLRKLQISGVSDVDRKAINALAKNCKNLMDIGFIDCGRVDETALGNFASVRFLSIAGVINIKWNQVVQQWCKLPSLIGLDVSGTDITRDTVTWLFLSSSSLKVLCAICCVDLEEEEEADPTFISNGNNREGKVLLAVFTDINKGVARLFNDHAPKSDGNIFLHWRNYSNKDEKLAETLNWLEWTISNWLLRLSGCSLHGWDNFWLEQGTALLLSFLHSGQEEVQEKAAAALTTLVVTCEGNFTVHTKRADAIIRYGGIRPFLNLVRSWREGLQLEAIEAILNLPSNAVVGEGGISILVNLAWSTSIFVAERATGALWTLSCCQDLKCVDEAFGIKALVDLIYQWWRSTGGERVLERVVGLLANLAADNKCCIDLASLGIVHVLVTLTRTCEVEGVQEQNKLAALALGIFAGHEGANIHDSREAVDALVQLTRSHHECVRQQAASALWNLSYGDGNQEAVVAAGGVEALVALTSSCSNASPELQEKAAGALWGLSESEKYSIVVVQGGGVAALIALARSDAKCVHESAAGAILALAFCPTNVFRIMEEGGVCALGHLCSSSASKAARFFSAMALAYMFDGTLGSGRSGPKVLMPNLNPKFSGRAFRKRKPKMSSACTGSVGASGFSKIITCQRMDEIVVDAGNSKSVDLDGHRRLAMKHLEGFVTTISCPRLFDAVVEPLSHELVVQITKNARIGRLDHRKCSRDEIERFVAILQNPSPVLKSCAAFALFQFTIPDGRFAAEHMKLLRDVGAPDVLRLHEGAPVEARFFTRIVIGNLEEEHHQM